MAHFVAMVSPRVRPDSSPPAVSQIRSRQRWVDEIEQGDHGNFGGVRHSRVVIGRRRSWLGVHHHTVARYVQNARCGAAAGPPAASSAGDRRLFCRRSRSWWSARRARSARIVIHERIVALGFTGGERTTRRTGRGGEGPVFGLVGGEVYRPWVTEPGLVVTVRLR